MEIYKKINFNWCCKLERNFRKFRIVKITEEKNDINYNYWEHTSDYFD